MIGTRPLSKQELEILRESFRGRFSLRDITLFVLGVNTGFRISELLSLNIGDVSNRKGQIFQSVTVQRCHTKGKHSSRTVQLNPEARRTLEYWVGKSFEAGYTNMTFPLFISSQGLRLSRIQAWRVLRDAYRVAGITGKVGTHSMRKTFANRVYQNLIDRAAAGEKIDPTMLISKALGHRSLDATSKYLSFRQEDVNRSINAAAWG